MFSIKGNHIENSESHYCNFAIFQLQQILNFKINHIDMLAYKCNEVRYIKYIKEHESILQTAILF